MDIRIPDILADLGAQHQRLLARPPERAREERQRPALEAVISVGQLPGAKGLVVRVTRPRVDGPLELLDDDVDEACGLEVPLDIGRVADGAAKLGRGLDEALLPLVEGPVERHGAVVAVRGQLEVLDFIVAAGLEGAEGRRKVSGGLSGSMMWVSGPVVLGPEGSLCGDSLVGLLGNRGGIGEAARHHAAEDEVKLL
jgi:hypothetical protein